MKPIENQTIFITGSTDGIGKLAALQLGKQGAHLLIHGRNEKKVSDVVEEIKERTGNKNVEGFTADLSLLDGVRKLAAKVMSKYDKLDVLINNAGVGFADERFSKDGYELRFAVNYLAPFLLTHLLLPALRNAAPSRIVNVSSAGQSAINFEDVMLEKTFDSNNAYTQSKLALIMFTIDLAERLKDENITVNSLHPGTYLDTNMVRRAGITPMGKPQTGSDAEVFLAVSPEMERVTGKYFNGRSESRAHAQAYDKNARKKLEEISLKLTGLLQNVKAPGEAMIDRE
ncbi:MAG TPA: SDR family NAD(P)-dependent oxidoreductase [Chitinophagaceae bacterium]|nr:SDR family NAD(P)-dependent oxidoreductase [Chitinophagaceae bacterium]